jgi:hypothetical protein
MATLTPKIGLKKPIVDSETDWGSRLNESLDILDDAVLAANTTGKGTVTVTDDGSGNVTISGTDTSGDAADGNDVSNAMVGSDGITVTSGVSIDTLTGFYAEFVAASGTFQTLHDTTDSPGVIVGGEITDDTDGTITVSGGNGFIRATDSNTANIGLTSWIETPLTPANNDITYVYVEYNGGNPQVIGTTTERTVDHNTNLFLGTVQRTDTFLHPTSRVELVGNVPHLLSERLTDVDGLTHASGGVITETGARFITVSATTFWLGLNEINVYAGGFDSSGADTFITFYRDVGLGDWVVGSASQIDNANYDDGSGTLAALTNNRYGVHWVYIGVDDDTYVIYGRGNYTTSTADAATPPADLPPHLQEHHGALAAKIVVQEAATNLSEILSAFTTTFTVSAIASHLDLTDIGINTHDEIDAHLQALTTSGVATDANIVSEGQIVLLSQMFG